MTTKKKVHIFGGLCIFLGLSWIVYTNVPGITATIKDLFSSSGDARHIGESTPRPGKLLVGEEVVNLQNAFADIAAYARDSVVSITATHIEEYEVPEYQFFFGDPFEQFFDEYFGQSRKRRPRRKPKKRERKYVGMGSGVIIDEKGYVLTNEHVIHGADEIQVSFQDSEKLFKAKIVGKDPRTDLAVIRILGKKKFKALPLGDSDSIRIGDWGIAIGSPFGLEQTMTVGIISAKRQAVRIENREYRNFIQTDAAINKGNSGGPLLNIKGEVIGINTAIFAPTGVFSGIGFAIPINNAIDILSDLIEKGRVVRGWLGVEIRQVDEIIRKQFGLREKYGALVNRVLKDSPAEGAGIERGDIILEFDGTTVTDVRNLQDIVGKTPPNKKVDIVVIRNKKRKTLSLKTAEMPAEVSGYEEPEEKKQDVSDESHDWIGMTVRPSSGALKKRYGIDQDLTGVIISNIERGSSAAQAGLHEGDLVVSLNLNRIGSVSDFKKVTAGIDTAQGVVFDIVRQRKRFYISFSIE